MQRKTVRKPFTCKKWEVEFSVNRSLKNHMKTHNREKPRGLTHLVSQCTAVRYPKRTPVNTYLREDLKMQRVWRRSFKEWWPNETYKHLLEKSHITVRAGC